MCKTRLSGYAQITMSQGKLELHAAFLLPNDTLFHAHRCLPGSHQAFHMMRALSDAVSDWDSVPVYAYVEGHFISSTTNRDGNDQHSVDVSLINTVTQGSKVILQDAEKLSFMTDLYAHRDAA